MKSKILVGLSALGLSLVGSAAVGCGDDSQSTGGGGGGASTSNASSSQSSVTANSSVTSVTSSSSSGMGDGNDTFADADPMEESNGIPFVDDGDAELNPLESDVDFYTFNGSAGLVSIQGISKPEGDPYSDLDPDLVLELYDANMMLIATNDDPYPRNTQDSSLLTILPEDGLYYLKVQDFCTTPGAGCPAEYFTTVDDLSYGIEIYMEAASVLANPIGEGDDTANGTVAMATAANYLGTGTAGQYYLTLGYGEFSSMADVDYFTFTMPNDVTVDADAELHTSITFQPPGKTVGSGSSQFTGTIRLEDTMGNIIASQDWNNENDAVEFPDLDVPVTPGAQYVIRVTGGAAEPDGPLAPFYIYAHGITQSNPLEQQEVTNSVQATPEVLNHPAMNTNQYFISGHLPALDTDYFSLAVEGHTTLVVVCSGERLGSGVRGLTVDVLTEAGMSLGTGTETADANIVVGDMTPIDVTGEDNIIIEITKTAQEALVQSDHYRCGFGFGPV